MNHRVVSRPRRAAVLTWTWIGLTGLLPPPCGAQVAAELQGRGMPYDAFDRMPFEVIEIGTSRIRVAFGPGSFEMPRERLIAYIRQSARTVAAYFDGFPVPAARLLVLNTSSDGRPIRSGTAFGDRGAAIKLTLAASVSESDLDRDWVLVHEMCHLALPSLPRPQHWFEEGMATYVEPFARAQVGLMSPQRVWGDLVGGLPQGLPQAGDRGLDQTPTWGRTYWGGALFCLLTDVRIRELTAGRSSFQQALRAMARHGNIEQESTIEPLLAIGDLATQTTVLSDLYRDMKDRPHPVDLDALWGRLGVHADASGIGFDDRAPLAALRIAMTQRV